MLLLENTACPQAAIGKAARYCATAPTTTVFTGDADTVSPPIALTGGAKLRRQLPLPRDPAHERRAPEGDRRSGPQPVPRARALGRLGQRHPEPQPLRGPHRPASSLVTRNATVEDLTVSRF